MKNRYKFVFFIFFVSLSAYTQEISSVVKDTVLLEKFHGKISYNVTTNEEKLLNGGFKFVTNPAETNKIELLLIDGDYVDGQKNGVWSFKEQNLLLKISEVNLSLKQPAKYHLYGDEFIFNSRYVSGIPSGNWKMEQTLISPERKEKFVIVDINFNKNGFPEGNFVLKRIANFQESVVKGTFNSEGFLHGKTEFVYYLDGNKYREVRSYENGFLLELIVYFENNVTPVLSIEYEDVKVKLEMLKNNINQDYDISHIGFGIDFNVGYNIYNNKVLSQENGNRIVKDIVPLIERYHSFDNQPAELNLNFTRRFKIVYPEKDSIDFANLKRKNKELKKATSSFLEKPRFIINRKKSYELSEAYYFLEKADSKLKIVDSLITKNDTGFFDFILRANYYKKGIKGLNVLDTVSFEYENKKYHKKFLDEDITITSGENLLEKLNTYLDTLGMSVNQYIDFSRDQLQYFDQEAQIDSLDTEIVNRIQRVDSLYSSMKEKYAEKEFKDRPIYYNLLSVFQSGLILDVNKRYINEDDFSKKIVEGNELVCLLDFFIINVKELKRLDDFNETIDILYTRFTENPFLDRKMETKIYPSISRKSREVLFPHYINGMLRARSCAELKNGYEKINRLERKLRELVKQNDKEVQDIERFLRRENVPGRIERVIGLND